MCTVIAYHGAVPSRVKVPRVIAMRVSFWWFAGTVPPHKGDRQNFTLFLQLLDPEVYADVTSIRRAMENRRAPFYLRRTKEAMVYFPERAAEGEWVARKVFTKRIPHSVDIKIDGDEFELYAEVTRFIRRQWAAARGEEIRARAVGFLTALYQPAGILYLRAPPLS